MSADNYTVCPRCRVAHHAEIERQRAALQKAYGVVPPEQFLEMTAAFKALESKPLEDTLRENFWGGIDAEGEKFSVRYFSRCDARCGFEFEFEHTKKLPRR